MNVDPTTLATVALATKATEIWLKPTLEKLRSMISTKADVVIDLLTNSFTDYLNRSYEKYFYLPTIVFPNQKKPLKDLYVPLNISMASTEEGAFLIDKYPQELFKKHKDVLIVDTAGMGKSTITKFVFLEAIEKNEGIPVIIELRKLSKTKTIIDFIYDETNGIRDDIDKNFIAEIIKRGDFIFLLDGYDEIPPEHKADVTDDLQNFKCKSNNNKFVLTSRDEPGLASFSEFQRFNILPLIPEQAFELIRKYAINQEIAESLIRKIQSHEYRPIVEFLKNPLLVSLLYKSYEYKPTIPLKMSVFYRQVYESLFENHDFSKGGEFQRKKKSGLDIDQFHTVLRALAYVTYQEGKTELDSDALLQSIEKAKGLCSGVSFVNSDFRNDLVNQVPLLIKDGNHYRWSHKSIQEYFAACFICMDTKSKEVAILNKLYVSEKVQNHINLLMLCCDIDHKSFRRTIVKNLLQDFLNSVDTALALLSGSIPDESIIQRKECVAFSYFVLINTEKIIKENPGVLNGFDPDPMKNQFTQAHINASKLVPKSLHASSSTTWATPTTFCIIQHQLGGLITLLAHKADFDFVQLLTRKTNDYAIAVDEDESEFILLDDSKSNPLNSPAKYNAVTRMIQERSEIRFDTPKARQYLRSIEDEIKEEEETDFFIH